MQDILVIFSLLTAITYLGYRAYKSDHKKKCGDDNCGCK